MSLLSCQHVVVQTVILFHHFSLSLLTRPVEHRRMWSTVRGAGGFAQIQGSALVEAEPNGGERAQGRNLGDARHSRLHCCSRREQIYRQLINQVVKLSSVKADFDICFDLESTKRGEVEDGFIRFFAHAFVVGFNENLEKLGFPCVRGFNTPGIGGAAAQNASHGVLLWTVIQRGSGEKTASMLATAFVVRSRSFLNKKTPYLQSFVLVDYKTVLVHSDNVPTAFAIVYVVVAGQRKKAEASKPANVFRGQPHPLYCALTVKGGGFNAIFVLCRFCLPCCRHVSESTLYACL